MYCSLRLKTATWPLLFLYSCDESTPIRALFLSHNKAAAGCLSMRNGGNEGLTVIIIPHAARLSGWNIASLSRPMVTVWSAWICKEETGTSSPSPEGISTLSFLAGLLLASSTKSDTSVPNAPLNPVPKSPSTIQVAASSAFWTRSVWLESQRSVSNP
ncbi:hypothetical protein SDC9_145901 [bioreactor metagenome]|uniref:Uncharacterized protein n=1 Tax=bioreactor metagenome TaxID=1076179 RepID=A0A645EDP5_9ZZZZ